MEAELEQKQAENEVEITKRKETIEKLKAVRCTCYAVFGCHCALEKDTLFYLLRLNSFALL